MDPFICKLFPFHFVLNNRLEVTNIGRSAAKLFPGIGIGNFFPDHFQVVRPRLKNTFDDFCQNQDSLFVVQNKQRSDIQIKGQVSYKSEDDVILFVFTPIIREVSFFARFNMTMDDLPFYDNTLEFLFALQAANHGLGEARTLNKKFEEKVNNRTRELKVKNEEIQAQNEEFVLQQEQLNRQSEYLAEKNRKLQRARELIHRKNRELKLYSKTLETQVQERTQDLTSINHALTEQNNQLEQFAFIVAHNLRAPIARILGLVNLMKLQSLISPENEFYINGINFATQRLEEVIKDLNIILEIRKGLNEAYEWVSLDQKTSKVGETLRTQIEESHASLVTDYSGAEEVYSISTYIENILYNLVSNAIKYRHPQRQPVVQISSRHENQEVCIEVKDNGIGFDIEANKDNLFKLYKRFHDHVEGKGIGLYMVKTQSEVLGGRIEVTSIPDHGTIFRIFLKNVQQNVSG